MGQAHRPRAATALEPIALVQLRAWVVRSGGDRHVAEAALIVAILEVVDEWAVASLRRARVLSAREARALFQMRRRRRIVVAEFVAVFGHPSTLATLVRFNAVAPDQAVALETMHAETIAARRVAAHEIQNNGST